MACGSTGLNRPGAAGRSVELDAYKTNILLELEKLAEMSGELQQKRELHRQYEEALNETTKLSKRSQSNP
jgi:hypothetical protein